VATEDLAVPSPNFSPQFEVCPKCKTIRDVVLGQKCACNAEFPEHMKDHPYIKECEARVAREIAEAYLRRAGDGIE